MDTQPASDRDIVLELFERHREAPGEPFDESRFLDYLLASPRGARAVRNSFSGLRRFNAFIDDVQLEFSICFSVRDREAHYSVQKFVDRVGVLKRSRRSSLASLRNQQANGFGWSTVFWLDLFAVILLLIVLAVSRTLAAAAAVLLAAGNLGILRLYLRERAYQERLAAQLQGSAPPDV
jgi:hypothetical protein